MCVCVRKEWVRVGVGWGSDSLCTSCMHVGMFKMQQT